MNSLTILNKETTDGKPKSLDDRMDELEKRVLELEINIFAMLKDMVETIEQEVKKKLTPSSPLTSTEGMSFPAPSTIIDDE